MSINLGSDELTKFLVKPDLYFGLRKGFGLFAAIVVFFGLIKEFDFAMSFVSGVLCMSIVDPSWANSHKSRSNELLAALLFCSVGTFFINLVSPYPAISWLVVCLLVFFYSMLAVYGKSGTLIGFSALSTVLINLNYPQDTLEQALIHSALTFLGCAYYWLYSVTLSFIFRNYEQRQVIATALYNTSKYLHARAQLYDIERDLDKSYKVLITRMSRMTDSMQAARSLVLRHLPDPNKSSYHHRLRMWTIYTRIVSLLDNMVATHTDYQYLRERMGEHDALLFMRDTLVILGNTLDHCATDLLRHEPLSYRSSVKAELRALEFEIAQLREQNLPQEEPETYSLVIQIYRRLRNVHFHVAEIANQLSRDKMAQEGVAHDAPQSFEDNPSLLQFRSTSNYSVKRLINQLKLGLNSAVVRYSLRAMAAIFVVQLGIALFYFSPLSGTTYEQLMVHSNWIMITVLLIMRPGFSLTHQRSGGRLLGTLLGCLYTVGIFAVTDNDVVILALMFLSTVLGNTYVRSNIFFGSIFITNYILIGFNYLTPGFYWVVGERFLDTLIASAITFAFSFMLPWWEKNKLPTLVNNTIDALYQYLHDTVAYVRKLHQQPQDQRQIDPRDPDYLAVQLSHQQVQDSYTLFADSLDRMMNEPERHQLDVVSLNRILLEADALGSQINSMIPIMGQFDTIPEGLEKNLDYVYNMLTLTPFDGMDDPPPVESGQDYISMRFPIRQMYKASQILHQEAKTLTPA